MTTATAAAARPAPTAVAHGAWLRLAAFAPLLLVGLLSWSTLVAPAARSAAWGMAVGGTLAGALLLGAGTIQRRGRRDTALAAVTVLLLAFVLLSVGIRGRELLPDRWDDLVRAIAGGIGALPGTLVPYRGEDEWVRFTLLLGGSAMAAIAVLQAFWPREPGRLPGSAFATAFTLSVIYAVPVVERAPQRPFLSGAIFAVLLAVFLVADRLRAAQLAPGAVLLALATAAGVLAAPALDRERPWVDYEQIAQSVAARGTVGYAWDHSYRPLTWPRRGRELLAVQAAHAAYWKAEVLDTFDGTAWRQGGTVPPFEPDGAEDRAESSWFQTITVSLGNLRTTQFITAGSASRIVAAPRRPVHAGGGTFETTSGELTRGASYRAQVYTPRPSPAQLRAAGTDYRSLARAWLRVRLTDADARASGVGEVVLPPFGSGEPVLSTTRLRPGTATPQAALDASSLRRISALAQRLRAQSATPYDYVRRVQARVMAGASYTERPTIHDNPLDAFLFDDRSGYCQHFSGAMALLLRLGGVPARVAVGFTPGVKDAGRNRWVVRDYDAHSWVEAYFPAYGWVTFDPTPAGTPARQLATGDLGRATRGGGSDSGTGGDRIGDPGFRSQGSRAAGAETGPSTWVVGGVVALGAVALGLLVALLRRRRRSGTTTRPGEDPWLDELDRALRSTGRDDGPEVTLRALEARLGPDPGVRGYLRALSARRYGRGGPPPSRAERAALRRALTRGRRRRTVLRAWLAVPPWPLGPRPDGRYPG